jgi:hypothetical protein
MVQSTSTSALPSLTTRTTAMSASTRPAPTILKTFNPWVAEGTLSTGTRVLGHLSGGSCFVGTVPWSSIADASNKNAWRCNTDQGLYDPCFAPPGNTNVTELACARTPSSGVYLLALSQPLPSSSTGSTPTGVWPWVLVLANGDQCQVVQGTAPTFGQVGLNYGCERGNASPPSTASEPWTVKFLATGAHALTTVTVTSAWE